MRYRRRSAVLSLLLWTATAGCGDGRNERAADPGAASRAGTASAASPDTNPVDGTVTVDTQAIPERDTAARR